MKNSFFLLVFLLAGTVLFGQVEREMVVVEIGTGTWCTYCPGAAMGADDLIANGHDVAVIENHNGDNYANVYSNARNSYYGITGYPTAFFDGVLSVVGGSHTQSMYGSYLPKYNARKAIPSSFTIDIDIANVGLDYTVTVTFEKVAAFSGTNIVGHLALTESHIMENWQGQDHLNFVNRLMVPSQTGTPLDFSGSNTQVVTLNFTAGSSWVIENCELVAFIQNNTGKEILQGAKKTLAVAQYNYDVKLDMISQPDGSICGGTIEPEVVIKNLGGIDLTSLDIEYSINGGSTQTYNWTGLVPFNTSEVVTLPAISYVPQANNTITVHTLNPNGQPDQNPANDTQTKNFTSAPQISDGTVYFELKTDQYPEETTWNLKNSSGTIIESGGPYNGQPNTVFNETWTLSSTECYTFTIFDVYGDGICCSYGNGYYKLSDASQVVFIQGGQFGSEESKPFEYADANMVTANFSADVTTVNTHQSVNFSDLSIGNVTSWNWVFEGGDPATSNEQNPTVTYDVAGIYDVSLTVSNGTNSNTETKTDYITVNTATGFGEISKNGINIYPNPFNSKTFITFALSQSETVSLSIYNTLGQKAFDQSYGQMQQGEQTIVINAEDLEKGVYYLQLTTGNKTVSEKITVVK